MNTLPPDLVLRKDFVLIKQTRDATSLFFSLADLERFQLIDEDAYKGTNIFQGKTAFPGLVRGRVRVVHTVEEGNALEEGEILVTAMTDPRYLSAIRRAGAIVTDEGGITCHAAIVSRELEKPCVIGTKAATKVLRTGDLVEVDAGRGIVERIG